MLIGGGAYGIRQRRKQHAKKREVVEAGVRCWGRILSAVHWGESPSVNGGSWAVVRLTIEAFVAPQPWGVQVHAVGTRVADKVVLDAQVSPLELPLLIPGRYCALLLHLEGTGHAVVDGFVTAEGRVLGRH
ncbi:hypothetical protein LXT21_33805 [Myxococcus sp. K38C18041901]|uniref:hypothetical protein n=1 Tax=Myxococcus guangdongensis TaxID=2906760 RepID=UPI0020A74D54|nr:hypothetical protein [Myxococcus guangdongensis]MCP3063762.1 hypothetical protein [Myxococcus guangdongensis]